MEAVQKGNLLGQFRVYLLSLLLADLALVINLRDFLESHADLWREPVFEAVL